MITPGHAEVVFVNRSDAMESHDFDDNQMYNMNQFFIFNLYLDDRGKEKIKKSD